MSNLISRTQAITLGLPRYFTGEVCRQGHVAERETKHGWCVACHDLSRKNWRDTHKPYIKEQWQRKQHGITPEQRQATLKEQKNCCAVCRRPLDLGHHTHQDHCKRRKKNRGILCYNCNVGLGYFQHSPALLKMAALYLEEWAVKHVQT